jgi:hypothetical protein
VVDTAGKRCLKGYELDLFAQLRRWAPLADLHAVLQALEAQREAVSQRIVELEPQSEEAMAVQNETNEIS